MNLGEKISVLRKEKGLSQEDLANKLNVSRQSVYKWESNQSTPELAKLITLSEIFDVSLDELVNGTSEPETKEIAMLEINQESKPEAVEVTTKTNGGRKCIANIVAGGIFLAIGIMLSLALLFVSGFQISALIYAVPFIVIGLICILSKKNTLLKCSWAVFIYLDMFARWATSVSVSLVLSSLSWPSEYGYARLAAAWVLVILMALLVVFSVIKVQKKSKDKSKDIKTVAAGIAAFIVLQLINIYKLMGSFFGTYAINNSDGMYFLYIVVEEIKFAALLAIAIAVIGRVVAIVRN